jgi:hypothetical protein
MKCVYTLAVLLLCPFVLPAQDLTGIWRGNFVNTSQLYREKYTYEVQLNELADHSLEGVTYSYSYMSKAFYGKADLQGIFMNKTGNLIFKENKMLEFKVSDQSVPCLMTCYLQYHRENGMEYLEGTYSSIVTTSGRDCGSGKVYLRRVETTDFTKEDFLLKKKPLNKKLRIKPGAADNLVSSGTPGKTSGESKPSAAPGTRQAPVTRNSDSSSRHTSPPVAKNSKPRSNPPAASNSRSRKPVPQPPVARNKKPVITDTASRLKPADASIAQINPEKDSMQQAPVLKKPLPPAPPVIRERENKLVKTIITHSPDIKIQLYDNGEIDGDTITVYHNNEVVAYKKRLSAEPITLDIPAAENGHTVHELVMVADNLGRIPPNTALMIVTTGGKRYELFIASTEQRNAKVIIEYQPQ